MTTEYQQRIFVLGKNLDIFKKSVNLCDIPNMLDNNIIFIDTLRNANKVFESLDSKSKHAETNTLNKSKELIEKYFNVKSRINETCSCMSVSNRSQILNIVT